MTEDVRLVEVDPAEDPVTARAALALGQAVQREREGEWSAPPGEELLRARWADPDARHALWVALEAGSEAGSVVGAAQLRIALTEPTAPGWLQVAVAPGSRRRGIGSALVAAAVRRAREEGRNGLEWVTHGPAEGGGPGRGVWPDDAFANRLGARAAQVAVPSVCLLPLDAERAAALAAEVAAHAGDYDVVVWGEAVPEELLADRALLRSRMSSEQPMGDRVAPEEVWDGARWRAEEAREAMRGPALSAGAVHRATGRLVAVSDVHMSRLRPEVARQGDTLVLAEHRGHRLGLAVKLGLARALAERHPHVRAVTTNNDAVNAPMLAVNTALGYRPTGRATIWSLDLR